MSDTTETGAQPAGTANAGDQNADGFDPITSQEQLDKIVQRRIERERAKFSDYEDLKARAEAADGIAKERDELKNTRDELQAEVDGYKAETERSKLTAEVAEQKGVSADLLAKTGITDREALEAYAGELAEALQPKAGPIPGQEKSPDTDAPADEVREFTQNLFQTKE